MPDNKKFSLMASLGPKYGAHQQSQPDGKTDMISLNYRENVQQYEIHLAAFRVFWRITPHSNGGANKLIYSSKETEEPIICTEIPYL